MEDRFLTTGPSGKSFLFSFPACSPITLWQIEGEKSGSSDRFYFLGFQSHCSGDCSPEIKRHLLLGGKAMTNQDNVLESRDITFLTKVCYSQSYCFSSSHVWVWKLVHKEGWAPKRWCFRIVVLEKTLESSLDCKEIKPVNPKGNQPWIFIGRTVLEVEAVILWPPGGKSWLIEKDPNAGKDRRQREKGMAEDKTVR